MSENFTETKQLPTAIPMGGKKWLRKSVTLPFLEGRLKKVDGMRVNIDPSSGMVTDALYVVEGLQIGREKVVSKVYKLVFQDGRMIGSEDFAEDVEEIPEPPKPSNSGEVTP